MTISEATLSSLNWPGKAAIISKLQISSCRERELLLLVAGGASNPLQTCATVRSQVSALYSKLSYLIDFVIGAAHSYMFDATIVFETPLSWRSFLVFPTIYLVEICLLLVGMEILENLLQFSPTFAPLLNFILMAPITFVLSLRLLINILDGKQSRNSEIMSNALD